MIKLIHLSDLHYQQNWEEGLGIVIDSLFKDINNQISSAERADTFIAFSGDFVFYGEDPQAYEGLFDLFDKKLNDLGISKEQRICVPGNHDVSTKVIKDNQVNHNAAIAEKLDERAFNDYVNDISKNVFINKFNNYLEFQTKFAKFGINDGVRTGQGWDISENVSVYCLNSAICSMGGIKSRNSEEVRKGDEDNIDKYNLAIDTRNIHKWIMDCGSQIKIMLMHHPLDWLTPWGSNELKTIIDNSFNLCLSGHVHDQDYFYSFNNTRPLVQCSAPPLFTSKHEKLGYSIIYIDPDNGISEIKYRQWTKRRTFVSGVDFSNTDSGSIDFPKIEASNESLLSRFSQTNIQKILDIRFNSALIAFANQPNVWVKPNIHNISEMSVNNHTQKDEDDPQVDIDELISSPRSIVFKALPQFGLTSFSLFMCKEAWLKHNKFWLYLDASEIESHGTEEFIQKELNFFGLEIDDVKCVIIDSVSTPNKNTNFIIKKVDRIFQDIPIMLMQSIESSQIFENSLENPIDRKFISFYLWSLPRNDIRSLVSQYNDQKPVGEVNSILNKLVSDLEVLNLPRTPLNCLILLKASEVDFDESPVNRVEMIKRVLFILFNTENYPTYKTKPDLKDSEFILGYFCELLIRENNFSFSRELFLRKLSEICEDHLIDLQVELVFDILEKNHILIKANGQFCFRFSYWVYYFAAIRMTQDENFASFILSDMKYTRFPEIVEFYTGIDRQRNDAISILTRDLDILSKKVNDKLGLPISLDLYKFVNWEPSKENIDKMKNELTDGISDTRYEDPIKDAFADRYYDSNRPYHQEIVKTINDDSLNQLVHLVSASARALRNSDFIYPELKTKLLQEILSTWKLITKVLVIISPVLALQGYAICDGINFFLCGNFGDDPSIRFNNIVSVIPINILHWFKDDIYSRKMGPLFIDQIKNEESEIQKHFLILLLIVQRSRDWKDIVDKYIDSLQKNSFYLLDVYCALRVQYQFSFASQRSIDEIAYLIKKADAKHILGQKRTGQKTINKISDDVLPRREV